MLLEGKPFRGKELEHLKQFLKKMDLEYDTKIEYSVCLLNEDYEIIGTGSVDGNVIKCVAIDPAHQGEGLSSQLISQLVQYEFEKARPHIFIYTKPKNIRMFSDMGFYTILQTDQILFMENRKQGFSNFLRQLQKETPEQAQAENTVKAAIVANCNPFTLGHRYLIEEALKQCDYLHLFILSDNRSSFSAEDRYEMVRRGTKDLERVILHRTSDYLISAVTFPTYFFKDQAQGEQANCRLDLELFGEKIAPALGISKRFVGTEPFCTVTASYNVQMKEILPQYGIEIVEIERKMQDGTPVSASEVRRLLEVKKESEVRKLVPETVFEYLCTCDHQK